MADLTDPLAYMTNALNDAKRARKEASDEVNSLQAQLDSAKARRDAAAVDVVNFQAAVDLLAAQVPPVPPA